MLILTRRVGESFEIDAFDENGEPTKITVSQLGVKGNQVRIGVDTGAAKLRVLREEVRQRIEAGQAPRYPSN